MTALEDPEQWELNRRLAEEAGHPDDVPDVPLAVDGDHDGYLRAVIEEAEALPPRQERRPRPDAELQSDLLRARLLHGDEILSVQRPEPLVGGMLDLGSFAVLYGRPKSGKSFVALDLAACIATGSWWHDHEVTGGDVLYLIAEGTGGMPERYQAWKDHNAVYSDVERLHWLPARPNLRVAEYAEAVAAVAADVAPVLIVIDTLARTNGGGNENSSEDMGAYIAGVDRIREATGACVLVVHHSGKDASAGARGHSSLLGALDTELEVKNGGDNIITLEVTAQKDHAEASPMRFTLVPAGESCAVATYTGRLGIGEDLTDRQRQALAILASIELPGGVTSGNWEVACHDEGIGRSTFFNCRSALVANGRVTNLGTDQRPRYALAKPLDPEDP